ncbi:GNAT family N-acetyltransferase [Saccharopolyspora taberi]|uniref:GNAT family N-acetyltransferase n=1 Tax=Saccharopolyspora taberi TaxID=60895 RepID=A0ABN3VK61_9PSEU
MRIRTADLDDLPTCQQVEVAAGALFREIGMTGIAEDPPLPLESLAVFQRAGRAWVAADPGPVAYVLVEPLDGAAHIAQISVHPDHSRKGVGRRLLDHVESWATGQGLTALTLTTFRDVPWNAPYYRRLGFRDLAADEITPGLAKAVEAEAAHGLDPEQRVCMRRDLG